MISAARRLASAGQPWHFSRVRSLLPCLLVAALAGSGGGCASSQQDVAAVEREQTSRSVEEQRVRAMSYGDAASTRGAEVLVPDFHKVYAADGRAGAKIKTFDTGSARTKTFYSNAKTAAKSYDTRSFAGAKASRLTEQNFETKEARARGKYEIPNLGKDAGAKTVGVTEARESSKTMAVRKLRDGERPYLGREMARIGQAPSPESLADWRQGGEATVTVGGKVEKFSTLQPLSIDDVRELLNKSK